MKAVALRSDGSEDMLLQALEGRRTMIARILLVEDNPITRKATSTALLGAGYRVLEAVDASAMRAILEHAVIDLVLLDSGIPDAEPIAILQELRGSEQTALVPILALTEEAEDARLLAAGFTDVLNKPLETTRVLNAVRIHTARSSVELPGEGNRILLVDGNAHTMRLTARRFEQLGFEVVTAADGNEAVSRLSESDPNIVVSELLSEEMDGFELCQAIHTRPEHSSLPVVLVSSPQLTPIDRAFAARVGANAAVTRTGDLSALVEAVLEALRPRSRRNIRPENLPVTQDDRRQAISTLEHRADLREDLARRDGTLRAVRSVLKCLSDMGERSQDEVLRGALASVLDAMGFPVGAAYLSTSGGALELRAQLGFAEDRFPEVSSFWGHLPLLSGVMEMGEPRGACASHSVGSIQQVLSAASVGSLILLPFSHGSTRIGILALGSRNTRLTPDWLLLSETVAGSIGFAVGLAHAATRIVETEQRFHGIADSTTEGIVVCDTEGRISYANAAFLRLVDLPSSVVVARHVE